MAKSPVTMAELDAVQAAIDSAEHPLSCSIWRGSVCSCQAQARAAISKYEAMTIAEAQIVSLSLDSQPNAWGQTVAQCGSSRNEG